jgi:hypothetical protein
MHAYMHTVRVKKAGVQVHCAGTYATEMRWLA